MHPSRPIHRALVAGALAAAVGVVVLTLVAVGQPLFTDDLWWHLALGRAYAAHGPWLDADPLLFTATAAPAPAAWLADLGAFTALQGFGFTGLRVVHVVLVTGILALVFSLARRASGSHLLAGLATAVFSVLSAYRLAQLRPHLLTILATLVLFRLLVERREPPRAWAVAAAVVLLGLWANLHAGFLVGLALLAAAAATSGAIAGLAPAADAGEARSRRRRTALLALALALGTLATALNPNGFHQHLAYWAAGGQTPALDLVLDEWKGLDLLSLPVTTLPPSPLAWVLAWGLFVATPIAAVAELLRLRRSAPGDEAASVPAPDPVLVVLGVGSLVGMDLAVRFSWLSIFPLLLLARAAGARRGSFPALLGDGACVGALALLPAFFLFGAWPMLSRGITLRSYASPYPPSKYYAEAVWAMADTGLRGNLFNEYVTGGFLGFWLAPDLQAFVNGTLNVPVEAMDANRLIRQRQGQLPGESFLELLDRYHVDVFFGIGTPVLRDTARPVSYSTTLLERTPGWILVFRDYRSAVYLRANARNRQNLERVAAWYAKKGVPFDPERGLDLHAVIQRSLAWAVQNSVVGYDLAGLIEASNSFDAARREAAHAQLARRYAVLGLYEDAIRSDQRLLRSRPDDRGAHRRIVWSLLHLGRVKEANEAAKDLGDDPLSDLLRRTAEAARTVDDEALRSMVAKIPILDERELASIALGTFTPAVRRDR